MSELQNSLIRNIDKEIYTDLLSALELGRWQSGTSLSSKQKDLVTQAIIAYENTHLAENERTAYIHKEKHTPCESFDPNAEQVIKFK